MKRTVAIFLTVIMTFFYILPMNVYADETEKLEVEKASNVVTYSCEYNSKMSVIKINGTMSHDAMIKYKGYSLVIYRLSFGQTIEEVINDPAQKPIASSDMSLKFQFSFEIDSLIEKYSKYAVLLRAPDGSLILTDNPQHVTVDEEQSSVKRKDYNFKGVLCEYGNYGFNTVPGTVIIPIMLDEPVSNIPKGYLYQNHFSQYYFNADYIDALDAKINSANAFGGRVYLQFLLPSSVAEGGFEGCDTSAEYLLPCVYSDDMLSYLDALTSFIAERYNGKQNGVISGIIVGKQIDVYEKYNNCGTVEFDRYAEYYFDYLSVVSIASHSYNSAIDIVVPFSSQNSYTKAKNEPQGFAPSDLLEAIADRCDLYRTDDFNFITLLENESTPVLVDQGGNVIINAESTVIGADNIQIYEDYLKKNSSKYSHMPERYMYVWSVEPTLMGNELAISYAYMYYKLCGTQNTMDSFTVSFENNCNFTDIKNIIRHIDDKETVNYTKTALSYFGISDWTKLIPDFNVDYVISHAYSFSEAIDDAETEYKGEHSYIEISDISTLANWKRGNFCEKMYISQHNVLGYVIKADFPSADASDVHGEIYYRYDKSESFLFTPFLTFTLMAENSSNPNAVYEVGVSLISDNNNCIETKYSLRANELTQFCLNIGTFTINNKIKSIKITARELLGNDDDFSLLVKSVVGKSQEYTTREIESKIFEERINAMTQNDSQSKEEQDTMNYGIILAVILAVLGIGFGVLVSFRKDSSEQK